MEYLKTKGANIVSIQIPELEESRIAHGLTIGAEATFGVESTYPNQVEELVGLFNYEHFLCLCS